MKNVLLIVLAILVSLSASADCNLGLAKSSANYLMELEKADLQSYQGGGACKVLDEEYKKCSEKQKLMLGKSVDLRKVLGHICMPYLPPPPTK